MVPIAQARRYTGLAAGRTKSWQRAASHSADTQVTLGRRVALGLATIALIACALIFALPSDQNCRVSNVTVSGTSMVPRYADGQQITVRSGGPHCAEPFLRGEVVVLATNSNALPLIKSLRGLPDDRFLVQADQIVVNGDVLTNSEGLLYQLSKARAAMLTLYEHDYHGVIPPDTYLVLGENPTGTLDSSRFGLISRDAIIGRVVEP